MGRAIRGAGGEGFLASSTQGLGLRSREPGWLGSGPSLVGWPDAGTPGCPFPACSSPLPRKGCDWKLRR